MTVNYLPGRPTSSEESVSFANWHSLSILAYCSGNNLIIVTKNFESLQTVYLTGDSKCCDINKHNGKIAVSVGHKVLIYKPVIENYYDYTFYTNRKNVNILNIKWELELEIVNFSDNSIINSIDWSESCASLDHEESEDTSLTSGTVDPETASKDEFNTEVSSELVVGSNDAITLWRLYYKNKRSESNRKLTTKMLWFKVQPSLVFKVKFSPDTTLIASCGKYDKLVKIWRRVAFGIETADFDLSYLKHPAFVTSLRWRRKGQSHLHKSSGPTSTSNSMYTSISRLDSVSLLSASAARDVNVLYTFCTDSTMRIFSSFEADSKHITQFHGSLNVKSQVADLKEPLFVNIIDNADFEFAINTMLTELQGPVPTEDSENDYVEVPSSLQVKLGARRNSSDSMLLEKEVHLTQLLSRGLELCLIMDCNGNVHLYTFENMCQYPPKFVKITQVKNKHPIKLSPNCFPKRPRHLRFQDFLISKNYDDKSDSFDYTLSLIFNDLEKGTIRHVEFLCENLIDPLLELSHSHNSSNTNVEEDNFFSSNGRSTNNDPNQYIGSLQHKYSGHDKSIQKLRRSNDGSAILSLTRFGESHLWTPTALGHLGHVHKHHFAVENSTKHLHYFNGTGVTLSRKALIKTDEAILDATVFNNGGDFVLTLLKEELICWDCRLDPLNSKLAKRMTTFKIKGRKLPLSFFVLPEKVNGIFHLVAIYSKDDIQSWEVKIDSKGDHCTITQFQILNFPDEQEDIHLISAIDPVGWDSKINTSGELNYKYDIKLVQQRDVLLIMDLKGDLRTYSAMLSNDNSEITWYLKTLNKTNIQNASNIKGSSISKCAIIDSSHQKLSIWDTKTNFLEYEEELLDKVFDLDWTCTSNNEASILAVGFEFRALLYSQLRYDYTNETPSYAAIRSVDISDTTTHTIGDETWLQDGTLVIGSGNQMYVVDKYLDVAKDTLSRSLLGSTQIVYHDIFTLGMVVNGQLPFFHPQFLIQSLFLEKLDDVKIILARLYSMMRDIDLDPDGDIWKDLIPTLKIDLDAFCESFFNSGIFAKNSIDSGFTAKHEDLFSNNVETTEVFNKQTAQLLIEKLQKVKLPFLTGHQQMTLVSVIEIVADIDTNYKSVLDSNGLRYYLGLKLHQLNSLKSGFSGSISMRDINFALHSDNKDLLFNIINDLSHQELSWSVAKSYGLVYWLGNEKLIEQFEKLARNEFSKFTERNHGKKDPTSCSIFYLALKKKQIVINLWKISVGHSEQQKMLNFLSHDFKEQRWKLAAQKNAFVLLSKHRYLDAAIFFLLGDALRDCVTVILRQLDDLALAVGVARVYEGSDQGPVFQWLLQENLLPMAVETDNRWLKSYVYHALKEQKNSIQCLIEDDFDDKQVLPTTSLTEEPKKKSFLEYDPVLIVLYQYLRKSGISSSNEYKFITKITKIYNRMGCDLLSLYIVKNWPFNYGQVDDIILGINGKTQPQPMSLPNSILTEDLTLSNGETKKFVQPPTSLEFNMDAFDF